MKARTSVWRAVCGTIGRYPLGLVTGRLLWRKRVPWWIRRLGTAKAASAGNTHPYLFTLGEKIALADTLENVPRDGRVWIGQWFVGVTLRLPAGDASFVALSPHYQTAERAERERVRLSTVYPTAATFGIARSFDPTDARQRAELAEAQRRALRGE